MNDFIGGYTISMCDALSAPLCCRIDKLVVHVAQSQNNRILMHRH